MKKKRTAINNNELHLQKLSPVIQNDISTYKESLDFVFSQYDLLNIAITGAYSAGKSSILLTYENINPTKKFIHISLAHFENNNDVKDIEDISKLDLEGKVLNQLLHQINPKKIPQTNFKIKKEISKIKLLLMSLLITSFIITILLFVKFNYWIKIVDELNNPTIKLVLYYTTTREFYICIITWMILISIFCLYRCLKVLLNKYLFKKFSLQGNEIEIFDNEDNSYFDKYLNEVIYLLKKSKVDAIVFEDIDRYDQNEIFSKLREVNILANKTIHQSVRFFYLLRDDVFKSKDRTKFFDFIIPIVPILDSSNSYDMMLECFSKNDKFERFDKSFLFGISLYIDDMRILKNIYNEFAIYSGRIQTPELDYNKFLGIIVYKNIFPKDFSQLQLNHGFVFYILSKDYYLKSIKNELNEISDKKKLMEQERANLIDELNIVFMASGQFDISIEGDLENRIKYIQALKQNKTDIIRFDTNNNIIDFNFILKELNNNEQYINRKNEINKRYDKSISNLESDIEDLRKKMYTYNNLKIKEIPEDQSFPLHYEFDNGELRGYKEIINDKYFNLIKYLLQNGYIDESYFDYLTYFYEGSLSKSDKIFIKSLFDKFPTEWTHKLNNIDSILMKLNTDNFRQIEILNFNLLDYLLVHNNRFTKLFLDLIENKKKIDFIEAYLIRDMNLELFIKKINRNWFGLWDKFLHNDNISQQQKKKYVFYSLHYTDFDDLRWLNYDNRMLNYILEDETFLDINKPDINHLKKVFKYIDVKFEYKHYNKSNKELFRMVYDNDLYVLNYEMVSLILEKYYLLQPNDDFISKNITLVYSKPEEYLVEYIEKNINIYLKLIFDIVADKQILDSEEIAIKILNNESIEIENKMIYLKKLENTVLKNENVKMWINKLEKIKSDAQQLNE